MANPISLESSIRTCKVMSGMASRIQSDRFQNSEIMQCPAWNGLDTAGRSVCPDSFYTKREGCNTALDRVVIENAHRPQYSQYINLDPSGLSGASMRSADTMNRAAAVADLNNMTGNFGMQLGATVRSSCEGYRYNSASSSQMNRVTQGIQQSYQANAMRAQSGMY